MNKEEYMQRLEEALEGVPQSEKEEALQYYNDYFDDAETETMQEVMKSLGSPENLAKAIKSEQGCQVDSFDTENYEDYEDNTHIGVQECIENENGKEKKRLSGGWIAFIIVLAVFASPIIFSISSGVIDGVFEAVELFFEGIVSIGTCIVVGFYMVFACITAAISIASTSPFGAVILAGIGALLVGICVFLILAVVWVFGVAIPWCLKGIMKLFNTKGDK